MVLQEFGAQPGSGTVGRGDFVRIETPPKEMTLTERVMQLTQEKMALAEYVQKMENAFAQRIGELERKVG